MSLFLPLLLASALVTPSASANTSIDDKKPRAVVIDTAAHRQVAADLVARAKTAAEGGSLTEARAQLLTANTMHRESGGLDETAVYNLVHIDYALDRYVEAADVLTELSDEALKKGNARLAAHAAVDAAELYNLAGRRSQVVSSVMRVRSLLNDSRIDETERKELRKRVG